MACKYPVDKLYGSVSQSVSNALLTYCASAYWAAEMQQKVSLPQHICAIWEVPDDK